MMNFIYELLCMGAAPSVSADELKSANFQQFMTKTLASAKHITNDEYLNQEAVRRAKTLLGQKSHSSQNTMRTIKTMFDAAKGACEFSRERSMLEWLEVCVTMAVQYGLDGETDNVAVPDTYDRIGVSDDEEEQVLEAAIKKNKTKKPATPKNRRIQASPRRKAKNKDADSEEYHPSEEEEEEEEENSDGDDNVTVPILKEEDDQEHTVPDNTSANGDAAAAKKKTNKKKTTKKYDVTTVVDPGAGTQAVIKYFATTQNVVLKQGYFCESYFFPSKESYGMFLSVLGSAKNTLEVCVYSLTDDDTANCLIAAKQRGVEIRIITDDQQAANKYADAKRLQSDYGIPYKDDHSGSYMHNKFAVIDSKVLINGSFNWSTNARFKNRENIMITNIPKAVKEFQEEFERLWELF